MLDLSTIGTAVAEGRRAVGLTQAGLAARAGVSRATVAALETGRLRELGFNKLMMLLGCVGLDLRIGTANRGRPTFDDLRAEQEADDPGVE